MKIEILTIGNELLSGKTINSNAQYLCKTLLKFGYSTLYTSVYQDDKKELENGVKTALKRADLLIITGGLGPTLDDNTKEIVTNFLKIDLKFSEDIALDIEKRFGCIASIEEQATIPKKEIIEQQIGEYVNEFLETCVGDYSELPGEVTTSQPTAKVYIRDDDVLVILNYEVTVKTTDKTSKLDRVMTKVTVPYGRMLKEAEAIVNGITEDPTIIDYTLLFNMQDEVEVYEYSEDILLYTIINTDYKIRGYELRLNIPARIILPEVENTAPIIIIENIQINQGDTKVITINTIDSEDDAIYYEVSGVLGSVDIEGNLKIAATDIDKGNYPLEIVVTDARGAEDSKIISIEVI